MSTSMPISKAEPADATPPNRFTSQAATAEDVLKSQTVGLVHLSDFRKRRAEALEQRDREAGTFGQYTPASTGTIAKNTGAISSNGGAPVPNEHLKKQKKRKPTPKGQLSFGLEDDRDAETIETVQSARTQSLNTNSLHASAHPSPPLSTAKPRLGPNSLVANAPRALTKAAIRNESLTREALRRDFIAMQEAVRASDVVIPFVFYDGTNIPGGACKIKKGDHVWLFLDRARKVGAESGINAAGERGGGSRRDWARVGVDDLILVRGEVIVPHHYELYYFLVNKTVGPNGKLLFDYDSNKAAAAAMPKSDDEDYDPISIPGKDKKSGGTVTVADSNLEGAKDDPKFTKVVDRRWYERNKHIFPASMWEEFDPGKKLDGMVRKDAEGNAFFFS